MITEDGIIKIIDKVVRNTDDDKKGHNICKHTPYDTEGIQFRCCKIVGKLVY